MHIFDPPAVLGLLLALAMTLPGFMLSAGQLSLMAAAGTTTCSGITLVVLFGVVMWALERRRESTVQPPVELCRALTV
jgi:hypothetical protein